MNKFKKRISKIILMMLLLILNTTSIYAMEQCEQFLENSSDQYCSQYMQALAYTNPEISLAGNPNDLLDTGLVDTINNISTGENKVSKTKYNSVSDIVNKTYKIRRNRDFSKVKGTSWANPAETWILIKGNGYGQRNNYSSWQYEWWGTPAGGNSGGQRKESSVHDFEEYIEKMTGSKTGLCDSNGFGLKEFKWVEGNEYSNPTVAKDGNKFIVGPFAIDYVYYDSGEIISKITDIKMTVCKDDGTLETVDLKKENFKKASNEDFPNPNEKFYIVFDNIKNATRIKNIKVNFKRLNAKANYSLWDGEIEVITEKITRKKKVRKKSDGSYKLDSQGHKTYNYYIKREQEIETGDAQTTAKKEDDCQYWYEYPSIERGINIVESNINIIKKITSEDGKEIDYNTLPKDNASRSFNFELRVNGAIASDNLSQVENITVMAGSGLSTQSRVYYWLDNGNNVPTFTLIEKNKKGYTVKDIKEIKSNGHGEYANGEFRGSLISDTSLNLEVTNIINSHKGTINIVKEIDKDASEAGKEYFKDGKAFKIKLTITPPANGFFKYENNYYGNNEKDKELVVYLTGEVKYDKNNAQQNRTVVSLPSIIEWYGDEAPRFKVEEQIEDNNIRCKSIIPETGTLVDLNDTNKDDKAVTVTVTNTSKDHKANLHIIKTVEIANNYSDELKTRLIEKIKNQKFEFDIKVDGFDVEHAVIEHAKREGNTYIWEYTSSEYTWQGDSSKGPNYKITEVNAPTGTHELTPSEGYLYEDETKDYKVDCNITNTIDITEHKAIIKLNKKVDGTELQDEDYNFDLRLISGVFTYNGQICEPTEKEPLRLTNAEGVTDGIAKEDNQYVKIHINKAVPESDQAEASWNSDEFTWYEYGTELKEKPGFTVDEVLTGVDVKTVDIQPNKGVLDDGSSPEVIINVLNNGYETLEGKIHIIKELENADRYDESVIYTYEFEFDLLIDRDHDDNWDNAEVSHIIIEPIKKENDNKFVWEWESGPITWKEEDGAPKYKVVEVEEKIPKGIEFKEGSNLEGTLKPLIAPGSEANIELQETKVSVINRIQENNGKLAIKKEVETELLKGKEFEFTVTVEGTFNINDNVLYDSNGNIITKKDYNKEKLVFVQKVEGGKTWTSEDFIWGAISAPKYTVEEKEDSAYTCISMINNSGYLKDDNTITATFKNKANQTDSAHLVVKKVLEPNQTSDKNFKFDITIDGKTTTVELKAGESYTSPSYTWNKNDEAPSYTVKEYAQDGTVLTRIEDNAGNKGTINSNGKGGEISGKLISGTSVEVRATNSMEEKDGRFKVKKQIVADEKYVDGVKEKTFKMTATVTGNFMYGDNNEIVNGSKVFDNITLKADETWESPKITWYGDNAPTVTVSESLNGDEYKGWKNIGISNNGVAMSNGLEIVVTNEYQVITRLDLTVELAGDVWEDVGKDEKSQEAEANGRMDSNETGIDGVEVYVYIAGTNNLATIYKDGLDAIQSQPIITSNNGHWDAFRVNLSDENDAFEVRFDYDGQTYENTKFLALSDSSIQALIENTSDNTRKDKFKKYNNSDTTDSDKINLFMGTISKSARNQYANTSMAKDVNRDEVDSRINKIYGQNAIDSSGNTIGKVSGSTGENNIYYTSNVTNLGDQTRVISNVKTTDNNGVAYDLFKATARTGKLVFPFGTNFEDRFHLAGSDTYITDYGTEIVYRYSATEDYTKHINLGLRKRPEADVEIQKDLVSAKVVVKDRLTKYTFNKLSDLGKDIYTRTLSNDKNPDNMNLTYTLGLYKTDYYYRAEMYKTNMDKDEYDKVEEFYKAVGGIDSTELEVYLDYKITIRNASSNQYNVVINSVEDYYDSTFKLITSNESRYIKWTDENGNIKDGEVEVAKAPYFEKNDTSDVSFKEVEKGIKGSDGVTYNRMSIDLNNALLSIGESANIYLSYKVEKGSFKGVQDAIALGGKSNIAEISSYSTYYYNENSKKLDDLKLAGKIDRDSAPANIDVRNHNTKNWYEDDTAVAPVLSLEITDNNRTVSGIAWEDSVTEESKKNGEAVGDGIYNNGESLIGGLTTELVEKVTVKNEDGVFQDYDFIWPTNQSLNSLGGMSLEHVTGFDSVIETSRGEIQSNGKVTGAGEYTFVGAPAGDYVVRFVYGDNKANLDSTMGMTGNATAYGDKANSDINTSNYAGFVSGKSATVYNGQDYKSTIYQAKHTSVNSDGYVNNKWHNLDDTELNGATVSDARDSEARRLEVIANSETISNGNASVLGTANSIAESHTELYNDYYMFADTAKLNMNIESLANAKAVNGIQDKTGKVRSDSPSIEIKEESYTYEIPKIDFGLIERPKNKVILDKEISSIKLTTNDGNTIFDAKYNISYTLKNINAVTGLFDNSEKVLAQVYRDGSKKQLVANIELDLDNSVGTDVLQALNKKEKKLDNEDTEGTQNFRFINIDESLLQGTTIEIDYKLTAINVGETDYTSEELASLTGTTKEIKDKINKMANDAKIENSLNSTNTSVGKYLGEYYYTGEEKEADKNKEIVTTRIRQAVEYIDNDSVFTSDINNTKNQSWKSTTANELAGNGYSKERLVDDDLTIINEIHDRDGRLYINDNNHNIALSIDSVDDVNELNKDFEEKLKPINKDENNDENNLYMTSINIAVSKVVSAQDDADNLTFDNIAEIVKFENSVGRRDMTATPGNSNPKGIGDEDSERGEFISGLQETDASATELVTFTPPTGIESQNVMTSQILMAIVVALGIVSIGIITIKKKILTK